MTSSLPSGVMSVTPATRDRPRLVTHEMIEVFERNNPALRGTGKHMVDLGVWVLESDDENSDDKYSVSTPGKVRTRDTTRDCVVCGQLFAGKIY